MLSEWIYLGGVKAFADGSLGSNSALFYEVLRERDKGCFFLLLQLLFNLSFFDSVCIEGLVSTISGITNA